MIDVMRILLLGPLGGGGSLPPYLDVLQAALLRHGADVDRDGTPGVPFTPGTGFWTTQQITGQARALVDRLDLTGYDVISLHHGNLEIEQLLPVLWRSRAHAPVVHHLHSLSATLFDRQVPAPLLRAAVADATRAADGYVFFGDFARRRFEAAEPSVVAWLPTTIPDSTSVASFPLTPSSAATVSLYGYAAPWKDAATLVQALPLVTQPCRVVLTGPFWSDPAQAGLALPTRRRYGHVELVVTDRYLGPEDRLGLVHASDLAIFPYTDHPSFQGSGAIADYLAGGIPVIATDVANMAELVGDAGMIIPARRPDALARAIDLLLTDSEQNAANAARRRAHLFHPHAHAAAVLDLYQEVIERAAGRKQWPPRPKSSSPGTAKPAATSNSSSAASRDAGA